MGDTVVKMEIRTCQNQKSAETTDSNCVHSECSIMLASASSKEWSLVISRNGCHKSHQATRPFESDQHWKNKFKGRE